MINEHGGGMNVNDNLYLTTINRMVISSRRRPNRELGLTPSQHMISFVVSSHFILDWAYHYDCEIIAAIVDQCQGLKLMCRWRHTLLIKVQRCMCN